MPSSADDANVAVTEASVDPLFNAPFIEVDEWRSEPAPHRYVHGGFKGTEARFSFYFPPPERYQGRFHHNTYPLAATSDIAPFPIAFAVATGDLGFTLDSGAYYVQTNNGSAFSRAAADPSVAAYRVNAAAAKYSRVLAAEMYGEHRAFGYLYGGSGGAYQTVGGAEHTSGVWDGFMPFVMGSNHATPSNFTVRLHPLRVLRRRNKLAAVMDAISPGGGGDMYAELDEEERAALREVTLMGFPPRGWYAHETQGSGYFADIQGVIPQLDPTYLDDFWSKPGYLGSDPAAAIHADRFQFDTTVVRVSDGAPKQFELAEVPERPFADAHLVLLTGASAGRSAAIASVTGRTIQFANTTDPAIVEAFRAGDAVRIDNAWALAIQTYQRHQVPPSPDEYGWNQFRDERGAPLYPQRQMLIGEIFTRSSLGTLMSGRVHGKVLLVQSLMDIDAFPWFADWYRSQVAAAMGPQFADDFALWFIDHAQHDNPLTPLARAHAVRLSGALQQGLRDLAIWVETGVRPSETRYRVVDSQVEIPATAAERGGVQPVVELSANGGLRAEVAAGEPVSFSGRIEAPGGRGTIVAADWDFEGAGEFATSASLAATETSVTVTATHAYSKPGVYFPVLRAAAQRDGDAQTPYARVENLARARIVVR
ncbi:hypothetical protein LJR219_002549 [Phenylobacterium sp. LjRoot219]|uniref:hypothetical protein n=1 Tax=Phenylobacterium sp. LjRoot219 TaxID=3342283 RepID=UPI003ECEAB0A